MLTRKTEIDVLHTSEETFSVSSNRMNLSFRANLIFSACVALGAAMVSAQTHQAGPTRHTNRSARFRALHPNVASAKLAAGTQKPADAGQLQLPDSLVDQINILKGYALAPVALNMEGRDPELVGLGSYLVNSSSCGDCHTNGLFLANGDPFKGQTPIVNTAGYMGGGRVFGSVTSRNLTPEPENGNLPAGMEFDEFLHIMRTGEDMDKLHPDLSPLLQTMPWPELGRMTDRDLRAIYEYLSALPPVKVPGATEAARRSLVVMTLLRFQPAGVF
jgi:hypothetical protein